MSEYRIAAFKMIVVYLGAWALGRFTHGETRTAIPGFALGLLTVSALRQAARFGGDHLSKPEHD